MSKKKIERILFDSAESVSDSVDAANEYLTNEGIDIDSYISRGLNELNPKINDEKLSKSQSYFRRAVLAAKIAHEYYNEWTFGSVKFQKIVYLSEQVSKMEFTSNYRKQAAGPMDHKFIHSIKKEFENQGWFSVKQEGKYKKWIFTPLENVLGYKKYYDKYFIDDNDDIQFLINSFRKWRTDKVELIATIFMCWLEINNSNTIISDNLLIEKFYKFHKSKRKFSENEIIDAISWMKKEGVYPN